MVPTNNKSHRREFFNLKKVLLATLATIGIFGLSTLNANAEEVKTDTEKTIYKVEQGDTLSSIGVKYGVDYSDIYKENKDTLKSAHLIFVGDKLEIPKGHKQLEVSSQYTDPVESTQEVTEEVDQPEGDYTQESQNSSNVQSEAPTQPKESAPASNDNSAKANRRNIESSNNYNIGSGNGYIGAYQFAPSTWNSIASKHGLNANDYSKENQDKVADIYANEHYGGWGNVPTNGGW